MRLLLHDSEHRLHAISENAECPASSLTLMGQPLLVRNISKIREAFDIKAIRMPGRLGEALDLVQSNFPSVTVQEYDGGEDEDERGAAAGRGGAVAAAVDAPLKWTDGELRVPMNSVIVTKQAEPRVGLGGGEEGGAGLSVSQLVYPWDFLRQMQLALEREVKGQAISPDASVARTAVIDGPCVIEDGAVVDDFSKIKGPAYIGKKSFVGMTSLVRSCMLGEGTRIGFNCEVAKTYFAGNDKTSHQNVILDSLIGKGVWFGGYSGTANVLLTRKNVKYKVGHEFVDTGTDHFGAVVGNNSAVGAAVIILPGRQVEPNSVIQAGTIFR